MFETTQSAEFEFAISQQEMDWFRETSGDTSYIHVDPQKARAMGFKDVIVYGGLMLLRVSKMVGEYLPGKYGVSLGWSIDYRDALYVGERAIIRSEVQRYSPAAKHLTCKFVIRADDRLIAIGKTESMIRDL